MREKRKDVPTLDDEKELLVQDDESGFSDSFLQASLEGENGKSYFVSMGVSKFTHHEKGTRWHTRFELNEECIAKTLPWKIPLFNQLTTGVTAEVDLLKDYGNDAVNIIHREDEVTVELPGMSYSSRGDNWDFRYEMESGSGFDLHFDALSVPYWFADGGWMQWTKTSKIKGFEAWSNVEGTLYTNGSPVKVRGRGVVERVKLTAMIWGEVNWYDWIWVISDDLYVLLFHVNNGEYSDGKVFLRETGDYLNIDRVTIKFPEVSYIPDLNHFVSTKIAVQAVTEKGILALEGSLLRMHKRAPYQDMEFTWNGSFSFWNGDKIILTNARGADEQGCYYKIP